MQHVTFVICCEEEIGLPFRIHCAVVSASVQADFSR